MTRKCVFCKETNYKNAYSFFSAPKDPELRKKWEAAIGIENYAVTDETYVCSKHFHKDDIITHWVSGVPPHVISIEYKKCRLRPGAIPGRNYHLEHKTNDQKRSNNSNTNKYESSPAKLKKVGSTEETRKHFLIPRIDTKLQTNNNENHRITSLHRQSSVEYNDSSRKNKEHSDLSKNSVIKVELYENGSNTGNTSKCDFKIKETLGRNAKQTKENRTVYIIKSEIDSNTNLMKDIYSKEKKEEKDQECKEDSYLNKPKKISESSKMFYVVNGEKASVQVWEPKLRKDDTSKEKSVDNFEVRENLYIKKEIADNLDYDQVPICSPLSLYNELENSEMLFEDLLEVCTEVLLPRGWSCLVTSKGHTTTIVYLYMGMTKGGMPFMEKQVFIKSDMMLHCVAVNKEINPFVHNLIKEGKHLKVQSLLDIQELIDEFDQRIICQGIYNPEGYQELRSIRTVYKDGIKWRHILCPLIINNDSLRCTRCATLSRALQCKSKNSLSSFYNSAIFKKKQQKAYIIRQKCKRVRKHDRRYESKSV
ncbi:uncharacterized protein LOC143188646 [Calliopsis andreniformis]|uniref:uncharacterized protein LOC143188646 n=1 Tax=Calliopsis andreniformis TaxID=337506 RepID=UPI003FCDCE94